MLGMSIYNDSLGASCYERYQLEQAETKTRKEKRATLGKLCQRRAGTTEMKYVLLHSTLIRFDFLCLALFLIDGLFSPGAAGI